MNQFELHRHSDGLIYRFDRTGPGTFARADNARITITWEGMAGWLARLPDTGVVAGRPWETLPAFQSDSAPPEGIWISRKDGRSHVYTLSHR
ncbi:MAG: hypothetical protein AAF601_10805 [Pseudomonadota bacterium]